jgi:hypothetical protein
MFKKILLALVILLVIIQFIRPEKNVSQEVIAENDISNVHAIPEEVHQVLIKKCYDCHSNNTNYPWYVNIQPVGWWLAHHVDEGKGELNFSEFRSYDEERANHKLEEIGEVTEDGSMPLSSYTLIHSATKITAEDKAAIHAWLRSMNISFEEHKH